MCVLLPYGSWSYWSAFSRYWSEGQTLQRWSALFLRSLHRGCRSDRQAPPHQSSDGPMYISDMTVWGYKTYLYQPFSNVHCNPNEIPNLWTDLGLSPFEIKRPHKISEFLLNNLFLSLCFCVQQWDLHFRHWFTSYFNLVFLSIKTLTLWIIE